MSQKINSDVYKFKKDHILYNEGDPIKGNSIFLLKKGHGQIIYNLKHDKKLILDIPVGSIFGLFETISNEEYRITKVKFIEESIVSMWQKEDFLINISMIPELGLKSIVCLSAFLRTLNQKIQEIG